MSLLRPRRKHGRGWLSSDSALEIPLSVILEAAAATLLQLVCRTIPERHIGLDFDEFTVPTILVDLDPLEAISACLCCIVFIDGAQFVWLKCLEGLFEIFKTSTTCMTFDSAVYGFPVTEEVDYRGLLLWFF
ncbi:hypothetical protein VTP01DRAFT_7112 [Rhizomucor pusillus]|uniref:uncharacterized protein n=1 Tax=Rhizomucor pusillus TaxID=4840 RepID=UPI0037433A0E